MWITNIIQGLRTSLIKPSKSLLIPYYKLNVSLNKRLNLYIKTTCKNENKVVVYFRLIPFNLTWMDYLWESLEVDIHTMMNQKEESLKTLDSPFLECKVPSINYGLYRQINLKRKKPKPIN